jgi:ATP-dependent Lon protease
MMLDEIDKLGHGGFHGDPASALLEVLDPEQNSTFRDNYLAVPYDLSGVMFIATANVLDTIPGPLRDRMEMIQLPATPRGEAADRAPLPGRRQLRGTGLKPEQIEITDEALAAIIHDYTREAGVRNLEREIGNVCRYVAVRIAEGAATAIAVDAASRRHPGPAQVRCRGGDARRHSGRGHRARVDAGGRRHPLHRGRAHAGQRQADPHGTAGRRDEGKRAGGALAGEGAQRRRSASRRRCWRNPTSTCTCPRAPRPRTGRARGSRCSRRLASLLRSARCASDVAMTGEISLRGLVLRSAA